MQLSSSTASTARPGAASPLPAGATRSRLFAWLSLIPGGLTFLWALLHHRLLLYGDATAHLMIARRMIDSATPGLSQWGSVWLPFPHLLDAALVWIPSFWKSGAAGALPSLLTFAFSVWALHRIVLRHWGSLAADWAATVYLLNPCLLYLAAVPMTESVYLAMFLGATDQIDRWGMALAREEKVRLGAVWLAAAFAAAGSLCRYDGWFVLPFYLLFLVLPARSFRQAAQAAWRFCLVTAVPPLFWFAYNQHVFHDWLAFARGPYSARQIYLDALRHGGQRYPGDHQIGMAVFYYLRTVSLNVGPPLLLAAAVGLSLYLGWLWRGRISGQPGWLLPGWLLRGAEGFTPLLLAIPLPWYVWAMFSGNVPIFIPMYWPHGYYNVRYGAQLLPAVAAFSGVFLVALVARMPDRQQRRRALAVMAGLVALSYAWMFHGLGPITYAEAVYNSPQRLAMESRLAAALKPWHSGQRILMFLGTYPGALADDGIPIHAVIQEANYDLWNHALIAPQQSADWIVVEDQTILSNQINQAAVRQHFHPVAHFSAPTEHPVTVYRRNPEPSSEPSPSAGRIAAAWRRPEQSGRPLPAIEAATAATNGSGSKCGRSHRDKPEDEIKRGRRHGNLPFAKQSSSRGCAGSPSLPHFTIDRASLAARTSSLAVSVPSSSGNRL